MEGKQKKIRIQKRRSTEKSIYMASLITRSIHIHINSIGKKHNKKAKEYNKKRNEL